MIWDDGTLLTRVMICVHAIAVLCAILAVAWLVRRASPRRRYIRDRVIFGVVSIPHDAIVENCIIIDSIDSLRTELNR